MEDAVYQARAMSRSTAVSNEALSEIGRVVANFALLEVNLNLLVHGLLGLPYSVGRLVTSEQPFRHVVLLAINLVRSRLGPQASAAFKPILQLIRSAEASRNTIVHSLWGGTYANAVVRTKYTSKERAGLTFQREVMTVDQLSEVAYQIAMATLEVEDFANERGIRTSMPYPDDPPLGSPGLNA